MPPPSIRRHFEASGAPSHALGSEQERGKALLQSLCSRYDAVGHSGASPHPDAPPFRTFGDQKLYDEDFAQRLQTGRSTIHKDMPIFRFGKPMPRRWSAISGVHQKRK